MAETIRDVVIRISLQQTHNKLAVPDMSDFQKSLKTIHDHIEEASSAQKVAAEGAKTMISEILKNTESLIDAQGERIKSTEKVEETERKLGTTLDEMFEEHEKGLGTLEDLLDEIEEKRKKALSHYEDQQRKFADSFTKTLDSTKALGDGVFSLTRGVILLGSTEKDAQKLLNTLVKYQGYYDGFKGGVDTVKSIVDGYRSLNTMVAAYTTTQAAAAAASTSFTAAGVVQTATLRVMTAAQVAFNAALMANPFTVVAASAAAAAGALYLYSSAAKNAKISIEELNLTTQDQGDESRKRYEQEKAERRASIERKNEIQHQRDLLEIRYKNLSVQEQIALHEQRQKEQFGFEPFPFLDQWSQFEDPKNGKTGISRQLEHTRELKLLTNHLLDAERQILGLKEQQAAVEVASSQDAIKNAKSALDIVNQQLAAEKAKRETINETAGRLDPMQIREVSQLRDKVERGEELTREELGRLSQMGGSHVQGFVSSEYQRRGSEIGGNDLFSPFTSQSDMKIQSLENERDYLSEALEEYVDEAKEAAKKQANVLNKIFTASLNIIDMNEELDERLKNLERKMQQRNRQI